MLRHRAGVSPEPEGQWRLKERKQRSRGSWGGGRHWEVGCCLPGEAHKLTSSHSLPVWIDLSNELLNLNWQRLHLRSRSRPNTEHPGRNGLEFHQERGSWASKGQMELECRSGAVEVGGELDAQKKVPGSCLCFLHSRGKEAPETPGTVAAPDGGTAMGVKSIKPRGPASALL